MTKRKVRPTARGYIRKNREAILKLLWDCQTDLRVVGEDYHAWRRVFESDRGNAVQILREFLELIKKLYYCHKDRCSDKHCCVKKDIWFRWRSVMKAIEQACEVLKKEVPRSEDGREGLV